jgi:CheY-like chemotaxis protein
MASVLVVEDEAFTALALVDELADLGHTVREAMDGEAALEEMKTFAPDILVTDLMMPKMNGEELIRHVRSLAGRIIPIVLISGVPEAKLPADISYDAYLGKPVDHRALGRVIERLLAQFRS